MVDIGKRKSTKDSSQGELMEFKDYLKLMVAKEASDLYLTTGAMPSMKIQGELRTIENTPVAPGRVKDIAYKIMNQEQISAFEDNPDELSMILRNLSHDQTVHYPIEGDMHTIRDSNGNTVGYIKFTD